MNSLYNQMYGQQQNQNPMMTQFNNFKQNPIGFLAGRNINIPQEFQNDPHGAVQHLLNNGQMSQAQYNQLSQMAQNMGIKLT